MVDKVLFSWFVQNHFRTRIRRATKLRESAAILEDAKATPWPQYATNIN